MRYAIIYGAIALAVCSKINDLVYTYIMTTTGDYEKAHVVSTYVMLASFILIMLMAVVWYFFQGRFANPKMRYSTPMPPLSLRRPTIRLRASPPDLYSDQVSIPYCDCQERTEVTSGSGKRWRCTNPMCLALHLSPY